MGTYNSGEYISGEVYNSEDILTRHNHIEVNFGDIGLLPGDVVLVKYIDGKKTTRTDSRDRYGV